MQVEVKGAFNQFAGKPDWNRIGKELRTDFPDTDVGVFLCGPNAIGDQLKAMCAKLNPQAKYNAGVRASKEESSNAGPRFYFHKETF